MPVVVSQFDRHLALQRETKARRLEQHTVRMAHGPVVLAPVIKAGGALELELHPPPYGRALADQPLTVLSAAAFADRHEVLHLTDPGTGEEASDQDIRVREVELSARPLLAARYKAEAPTALGIEDCGEYARRVEAGTAVPVDRPFGVHESGCVKITDQPVLSDR